MKNRMRAPEKCLDRNAERVFFVFKLAFSNFLIKLEENGYSLHLVEASRSIAVHRRRRKKEEKLMINRHTNYLIYRRHVSSSIFYDI